MQCCDKGFHSRGVAALVAGARAGWWGPQHGAGAEALRVLGAVMLLIFLQAQLYLVLLAPGTRFSKKELQFSVQKGSYQENS